MMSASGGLKPRAVAGGPSVTRFTHKSCTGTMTAGGSAGTRRERGKKIKHRAQGENHTTYTHRKHKNKRTRARGREREKKRELETEMGKLSPVVRVRVCV